MIVHRKRLLYTAIIAAASAMPGAADAVQLSPDGHGQVLLYPYYTTRQDVYGNAYATLMSVVNATATAKAVKVRFLEGKNGRTVLDFNVFLSAFDVWTAAVLPDTNTGGAKIGTFDMSCTLPAFSASAPFVSFTNAAYSGTSDDGAGTGLDRAKEGYFEIIEMATYSSASVTGKAVTHLPIAVAPFNIPPCNAALADSAVADARPPAGDLFGSATIINVNSGTDYSYDPVALANFNQVGPNYTAPGTSLPDLTQASPPISTILGEDGRLYESLWASGTADAVSAVLMQSSVMNEYVLDTATKSQTDWVVTLPTKRLYTSSGTGNATKLFQRNFNGMAGSCDDVGRYDAFLGDKPYPAFTSIYDREERNGMPALLFPEPPGTPFHSLCWQSNVLTFRSPVPGLGAGSLFGSTNGENFVSPEGADGPFLNGWMEVELSSIINSAAANAHKLINIGTTTISGGNKPVTTGTTVTYVGLPVIGFAATSYTNNTLVVGSQAVLSNYGGTFTHKSSSLIQ